MTAAWATAWRRVVPASYWTIGCHFQLLPTYTPFKVIIYSYTAKDTPHLERVATFDRSFAAAGPRAWNDLPFRLRDYRLSLGAGHFGRPTRHIGTTKWCRSLSRITGGPVSHRNCPGSKCPGFYSITALVSKCLVTRFWCRSVLRSVPTCPRVSWCRSVR